MANAAFLQANRLLYAALRPLIFRGSAQRAHEQVIALLRWLDGQDWAVALLRQMQHMAFDDTPVSVGGVTLPYPLMLAAGLVKGDGFTEEASALAAVEAGRNVIPGWRSMPALVGPVEFGSFTRWPRLGNPGIVIWRDAATRSTQNRVGLKNPGAQAAAAFLARHRAQLPPVFGINIAVSPGVTDPAQEQQEALESLGFFLENNLLPSWFTLNLSCPNTDDDPGARQTESRTRALCAAVLEILPVPLWVKLSPDLSDDQYPVLMHVFAEVGVRAVIASNTLACPAPDGSGMPAGIGGGKLHERALAATIRLVESSQAAVEVIACGGVLDAASYRAFQGLRAAQYWSALIYRGPLAAALILDEVAHV